MPVRLRTFLLYVEDIRGCRQRPAVLSGVQPKQKLRLMGTKHEPLPLTGIGLKPPRVVSAVQGGLMGTAKRRYLRRVERPTEGYPGNGQVVDPASGHTSWSTSDRRLAIAAGNNAGISRTQHLQ